MTSVILIMGKAGSDFLIQLIAMSVLISVLLLCLLVFIFASRLMAVLGLTGVNVIGRVFGIVLAGTRHSIYARRVCCLYCNSEAI